MRSFKEYLKEYISSREDTGIGGNSESAWGKRGSKVFLYIQPHLYWYDSAKDMVYQNRSPLKWKKTEAFWEEIRINYAWSHSYEKSDILRGRMTHYQLFDTVSYLLKKKILPNQRDIYKESKCVKGRVDGQRIYIDGYQYVYNDPQDPKMEKLGERALSAIYKYIV